MQTARTRILVPPKVRHPPQSELCLRALHCNCHLQTCLVPFLFTCQISAHKYNVGTIAGAVGGAIAVLLMFAACLELNIYPRRRVNARRQMRDGDRQVEIRSVHSNVSGNSSLLPRYFPRTQSNAPPPYVGPTEESSVATQSDLSSVEIHHQIPPPFCSTPSQPATMGAIPPLVPHNRGSPPPVFSASPPVYQSQIAQQISPRVHTKDTEPASVEVAPILLPAAIVSSSRPTRTLRQSRSSSLPDLDTTTTSSSPGAMETRLSAEY